MLGAVGRWGCSEHFKPVSLSSKASPRGLGESVCERLYKQRGRIWEDLSVRIAGGGWVRERDLDAFLRWGMKKCSRRSELSLQSLGLKRLCCRSGNLNKSAIGASANERLLSRA